MTDDALAGIVKGLEAIRYVNGAETIADKLCRSEEALRICAVALQTARKDLDALRGMKAEAERRGMERAAVIGGNVMKAFAAEKGCTKTPEGRTAAFYQRKVQEAIRAAMPPVKP